VPSIVQHPIANQGNAKLWIAIIISLAGGGTGGAYGMSRSNDSDRQHGGQLQIQAAQIEALKETVGELKATAARLDKALTKLEAERAAAEKLEERNTRRRR
jgi:hypothetical protein